MARMVKGMYVPDAKEVVDGRYTPIPSVSGQWFEPDGNGGGTLYLIRRRNRPGFRKPVEERIAIKKTCLSPAMVPDHADDERRHQHGL